MDSKVMTFTKETIPSLVEMYESGDFVMAFDNEGFLSFAKRSLAGVPIFAGLREVEQERYILEALVPAEDAPHRARQHHPYVGNGGRTLFYYLTPQVKPNKLGLTIGTPHPSLYCTDMPTLPREYKGEVT